MVEKNKTLARAHVPFVSIAFSVILLVASSMSFVRISAESGLPDCPPSIEITNPAPGQLIDDDFPLELSSTNPGQPLQWVKFFLDDDVIGNATQDTVNPNFWRLIWDTTSVENDDYELTAEVKMQNTGNRCRVEEQPVLIDNDSESGSADLEVQIIPDEWVGPTNVNYEFEAIAYLEDSEETFVDVTDSTTFTWSTTIGSVNGVNEFGDYFSGPQPGVGEVSVTAQYGGQTEEADAFVDVTRGGNNFSYPDLDDDDDDDDEDQTATQPQRPGIVDEERGRGDQELASCIKDRLGDELYNDLIENPRRFSAEQFAQTRTCFAQRQYVVPSNLAPVNPNDIAALEEHRRSQITGAQNTTDADGRVGLEFTGTTEPDAALLIYIFSEPLVLTTQADSDGRWSYTLEDPLAPGDHEAYVLVETDGVFARSSSFAFAIAQEAPSDDNPNGYGLTLTTAANDSQTTSIYIAGVAVVVLMASVFLTRFVWFKRSGASNDKKLDADTMLGLASDPEANGAKTVDKSAADDNEDV